MNTTKVILMTLGLLCVILVARSVRVASRSNDGSKEKEVRQAENIKDYLNEVTQIGVFQWISKDRKYIGSLKKDTPAFQSALKALQESQTTDTRDVTKPEYEMVLMGEGVQHLAKYDAHAEVVTLYPPQRAGKPNVTVRVNRFFADLLTGAKLPDQPKEDFRPQHTSEAFWAGLPDSLVRAIAQSSVILIGKPVDLLRCNYFDPSDTKSPVQYTVYVIEVERYLKDSTGQFMPFVKYWDYGGVLKGGYEMKLLPLLKYNQRYLLFLLPGGNRGMALWNGKQIRLWYPDEFTHANPFLQTPIVNGVTVQRYPTPGFVANIYFFGDKTTLVGKPEGQVISEISAAIEPAKQERR